MSDEKVRIFGVDTDEIVGYQWFSIALFGLSLAVAFAAIGFLLGPVGVGAGVIIGFILGVKHAISLIKRGRL